jgi:nonribosomal peptide synthetase DhbF
MCGAEVLPPRLKDCFFSVLDAKLLHLYGPTEAAISVTGWECDRQREDGPVIPLGRPMSNVQIYLLDCSRRPVPAGVPGEIFIGGMAVARGYLKRPQLTAERFLPNPFRRCREGDDLLYRTGDLARFRSDGILEFIGRIDQQVKIHGARVEPREVEITLNRHPAVKRAAVRPQPDRHGETRLIAYVLVEEQSPPSLFSLREHCAAALPAFMVPAAFVVVEEMPLLTNGKIDYSRLPALEGQP